MTNESCSAGADAAAAAADNRVERPRLTKKQLITKEDGRYLIFYEFDGDQRQTGQQQ